MFMLKQMTDGQKFMATRHLCQKILSAVVDKELPLDADSSALLLDSLALVRTKVIIIH